jgi:serine/threonine protein kinase/Tol biopolymer transport system component
MKTLQWEHAKRLFELALNKRPEERSRFLEENCGGDTSLRDQVLSLIERNDRAGSFLERPFIGQSGLVTRSVQVDTLFPIDSVLLSRFRILRLAGRGGMGEVYEAEDLELHDRVALKAVRSEVACDPASIARFKQEIQLARRITHPNVIRLFDLFTLQSEHDQGPCGVTAFVTMEFLSGTTLAEKIRQTGPLQTNEAISIGIQLCSGLAAAHRGGVIHRDFKSGNVMLVPTEGRESRAVITDFGLALTTASDSTSSRITQSGALVGTLPYMAPEQLEGGAITQATDIYALGLVLYEMATGATPFAGESPIAAALQRLKKPPKSPRLLRPDLDPRCEAVILKCLEYDPERRYQTAEAVEAGLMASRTGLAQRSHTPWLAPFKPAVRARLLTPRAGFVIFAATLALILGGFGLRWWLRNSAAPGETQISAVPLTTYPGEEIDPSFSSDGGRIAFSWRKPEETGFNIYVKLIGPGEPVQLTHGGSDFFPAWSPDGNWIAFLRVLDREKILLIMPALGGPERELARVRGGVNAITGRPGLSWSADSKWLFTAEESKDLSVQITRISVENGEKHQVTAPPASNIDSLVSVSPDGSRLAFVRSIGPSVSDIYFVPLLENEPVNKALTRLTFDNKRIRGLAWTHEGRELVFSSTRNRQKLELWKVDTSGKREPRQLIGLEDEPFFLAASRQGSRLVYTHRGSPDGTDIWRVPIAEKNVSDPVRFIASTRAEWTPQYSPDGKRIAFESERSGSDEIWVCDEDGSNLVQLTSMDWGRAGSPRWSPDGQQIAFDSHTAGNWDVYVVSSHGGKPRRLTTNPASDAIPSWSRDGAWIYYSSTRTGRNEIWKTPVTGGPDVRVTQNGGVTAFESYNGDYLYFTKEDDVNSTALWKMPVQGGDESQVVNGVFRRDFVTSTHGIFFVSPGEKSAGAEMLRFVDYHARSVKTVARLGRSVCNGLTVSPDERFALYTACNPQGGSDLMLIDKFH